MRYLNLRQIFTTKTQQLIILICIGFLAACGGKQTVKKEGEPARASTGRGGYYLDDGPGENPPANIEGIPDAQPKTETLLVYPNKPYSALGKQYKPMTEYAPYVQQGVASWYGRRYHGKKTSSGEVYDMYSMTGAHTTLPIPSYVKVTNLENKRSVIVRINDRGPFKHDRLIDLSYAAAYKLRLTDKGSGMVQVEWIDTSPNGIQKLQAAAPAASPSVEIKPLTTDTEQVKPVMQLETTVQAEPASSYYVQVGAFKNETNSEQLQKKVLALDLAGNAAVTKVYNDGIYRVKLGPFSSRRDADLSAAKVRKQLNLSVIVTNQ